MSHSAMFFIQMLLAVYVTAHGTTPVQKVIEMLGECQAKVESDLAADAKAMEEFTAFCDDELKDKGYAISTAKRSLEDLSATIDLTTAQIGGLADEIATLGTTLATKDKELAEAVKMREAAHSLFVSTEKELVGSIDQLSRATALVKKGTSFVQSPGVQKRMDAAVAALRNVVNAAWLDLSSRKSLQSFLQDSSLDDLSLSQPQAKEVAFESSSGGILETLENMADKAQNALSNLRKKETSDSYEFNLLKSSLTDEINHGMDKVSTAQKNKAAKEEFNKDATGKMIETSKSKAADEQYSATLNTECTSKAAEWAARKESAQAEIAAISNAKGILSSGVKVFVQVGTKISAKKWNPDDNVNSAEDEVRDKLVNMLKKLSMDHHSFAFAQLANVASSDPFVKVRGLLEDMLAKLLKEAQAAATQQAFCEEEKGKSRASLEEKSMTLAKLNSRIDGAESRITTLEEDIKTLETEMAENDKMQREATALRLKEHEDYMKASKDFKDSAVAVAKAIEVLGDYYSNALMQIASKTVSKRKLQQPTLGTAKSDTASTIISVLQSAEQDFTTLLAETEATEKEAEDSFTKLSEENTLSKAAKQADAKAKASEVKSLTRELGHHKEDQASVSKESDAVSTYLASLSSQCDAEAVSYANKKAAREAEIAGLKDALDTLEGVALVQTHRFRQVRRV